MLLGCHLYVSLHKELGCYSLHATFSTYKNCLLWYCSLLYYHGSCMLQIKGLLGCNTNNGLLNYLTAAIPQCQTPIGIIRPQVLSRPPEGLLAGPCHRAVHYNVDQLLALQGTSRDCMPDLAMRNMQAPLRKCF